ncbi:MAG: uroporphyrinogen decarboxylase, partial [Peptococcaceae bacterium]|nr:uroporphyrinogen decarboxylase [Peptococcaceae bacterium]
MDIKELQAERTGIFRDVYSNKIPKRVPVNLSLTLEFTAGFGNLNMAEAQWNLSLLEDAADKLCQTFYSDSCPFGGSMRYPSYYQTLQSQSFIMGSNGFIQHPEVVGMDVEDYDYLIEKPFDCIVERIIPRQY